MNVCTYVCVRVCTYESMFYYIHDPTHEFKPQKLMSERNCVEKAHHGGVDPIYRYVYIYIYINCFIECMNKIVVSHAWDAYRKLLRVHTV